MSELLAKTAIGIMSGGLVITVVVALVWMMVDASRDLWPEWRDHRGIEAGIPLAFMVVLGIGLVLLVLAGIAKIVEETV